MTIVVPPPLYSSFLAALAMTLIKLFEFRRREIFLGASFLGLDASFASSSSAALSTLMHGDVSSGSTTTGGGGDSFEGDDRGDVVESEEGSDTAGSSAEGTRDDSGSSS